MARSARQSKILELISVSEIEKQDDLVNKLKSCNFDVTQATVSRDIKELGIVKVLSSETGKYKYFFPDNSSQASNKYIFMLKESIISMKTIKNFVLIKTLKDLGTSVCGIVEKLNIENSLGIVSGNDTVMMIFADASSAEYALGRLNSILNV